MSVKNIDLSSNKDELKEIKKENLDNNVNNILANNNNNNEVSNGQEFKPVQNYQNNLPNVIDVKTTMLGVLGIFGILVFIAIFVLIIAFGIFTVYNANNDNIVSGIFIKNVDISNLSKAEAKEKISNYINSNLPENIALKHNDYETSIPLSSLNLNFDIDSAVDSAYLIGKNGNVFQNSFQAIKTMFMHTNIEPSYSLDIEQLKTSLKDISSKLPDTVKESGYYIEGNSLVITPGNEGNIVNVSQMVSYIKNGLSNLTLKDRVLDIATIVEQPSKINIDKIYEEIYKEPVDAYYTQDPYAVFPSENGMDFKISLDEAKTMLEEQKDEYVIPLKVLYPKVTTNMIGREAFPDLLSTYSTKYSTRDRDRTTNLQLAANKINGTVLMPGEVFSYNQVVGERTIAAGYKEAPIYVSGKVVDGLGGGICQITSTLYNAVLYANLGIVSRSNHQFVPSYVTASRDATVVYGAIDFKFKNTRDYPIKITCSVSGGIATFNIYGLRSDNEYDVEISSRVTGTTANAIYSEAYRILKQNGQVIKSELLSRDTYKRH